MEEKKTETPLDRALEIQEALKPLTYEMLSFCGEGDEITVKLRKVGVYSDLSMG
jgi:hypothetical protein